jgi:hypothetical protein
VCNTIHLLHRGYVTIGMCSVQNHRGAMMELGEGLCKLRKLQLDGDAAAAGGPFSRFRDEVAAVLQFLYRTQKELAACTYVGHRHFIVDLCAHAKA